MYIFDTACGVNTPPVAQALQRRKFHRNFLLKIRLFVPAHIQNVARYLGMGSTSPLAAKATALGRHVRVELEVDDDVRREETNFRALAPLHVDACSVVGRGSWRQQRLRLPLAEVKATPEYE